MNPFFARNPRPWYCFYIQVSNANSWVLRLFTCAVWQVMLQETPQLDTQVTRCQGSILGSYFLPRKCCVSAREGSVPSLKLSVRRWKSMVESWKINFPRGFLFSGAMLVLGSVISGFSRVKYDSIHPRGKGVITPTKSRWYFSFQSSTVMLCRWGEGHLLSMVSKD